MLKQLRIKFVAVTMSLIAVLLCVIMVMLYSFTAAALDKDVTIKMQSISENLSRRGLSPDRPLFDERLHYFILTKNIRGDLIAVGSDTFDLSDADWITALYEQTSLSNSSIGTIREYALKYMHVINMHNTILFVDISDEMAALHTLKRNCLVVGLLSLLAFAGIMILLANWIVRPVETAWEHQKQFVADASHELKTPLTVIMTNTEMLASPAYSQEEKARFVENTANMTKRMRYLVEGMLDLARVDSGVVRTAFTQLDYSDLTEQCLLPFEPMFFESGRFLESDIAPNIRLNGSETHLRQVTDILLDNALKYSHPETTVRLTLSAPGKYAVLCVDSMGDSISQEDLQNIFHRFYTVDKARTGDSYGLGLSIASGIVDEHKGKIWAESDNGHNRFFVKLPL